MTMAKNLLRSKVKTSLTTLRMEVTKPMGRRMTLSMYKMEKSMVRKKWRMESMELRMTRSKRWMGSD